MSVDKAFSDLVDAIRERCPEYSSDDANRAAKFLTEQFAAAIERGDEVGFFGEDIKTGAITISVLTIEEVKQPLKKWWQFWNKG